MPSENVLVRQQEKPNHYQYVSAWYCHLCFNNFLWIYSSLT